MALPQPPLPSPPLQPPSHIFSPILIAMLGITTIGSLLIIYHFISSKFPHPSPPTWPHHQQPLEASGLDQCILDHIPIHDYKLGVGSFHLDHTECAVCLSELEEGEHVRVLPDCGHVFHVQCIDQWFASHSNCPLCRSPIVLAPVADVLHVPLIEVVAGGGEGEVRAEPGSRGYGGLHRAFASPAVCEGIVQPVVVGGLKRSFSMDVSVRVRSDIVEEVAASSSSSSSVWFLKKSHSQKRFDRASSMLVRSLSRLRMGNDGGASGSLPR